MPTLHAQDQHLVRRLLRGDEAAYEELFAERVPRLYRLIASRCRGDLELAEDVLQATLLKVMAKLASYRAEASLLTWMGTLGLRELVDAQRREGRHARVEALEAAGDEVRSALELLEQPEPGPEAEALRRELCDLVVATLDRLPARYARVLSWKYLEGWSVEEIADHSGDSRVAVQSALQRARDAFREAFEPIARLRREAT